MYGSESTCPITGNCLRNIRMVGKKSLQIEANKGSVFRRIAAIGECNNVPEEVQEPKGLHDHTKEGHLKKTSSMPPKKQSVPRNFCFRAKK